MGVGKRIRGNGGSSKKEEFVKKSHTSFYNGLEFI